MNGFLEANGLPQSRCFSALRLGNKLLELERQMDPDFCGLLMFCHSELWHVNYNGLPAVVQKLNSDETLMALVGRNKGWFLRAAASYEGVKIPVFQ